MTLEELATAAQEAIDNRARMRAERWVPSVDPLQQRRPESVADWGRAARFDEAGAREWAARWPCLQAVRAADVRASVAYVVLADGVRP